MCGSWFGGRRCPFSLILRDRVTVVSKDEACAHVFQKAICDSPARKRGRERTVLAAIGKSNKAKRGQMRKLRLKPGPLHLAAIVLMHLACMSLIVWLSF